MVLVILITTLMTSFAAFALPDTPSIYTDFRVPEFGYSRLSIGTSNLRFRHDRDDDTYVSGRFNTNFFIIRHSDLIQWNISEYSYYNYHRYYEDNPPTPSLQSRLYNTLNINYAQWFNEYSGKHVFASGWVRSDTKYNSLPKTEYNYEVGGGYGRVQNVYPVVLALVLNDEIDGNLSNDEIMEIADIITKVGYYDDLYRDDFDIKYYQLIANKLKKPEESMKVRQIIRSNIYRRSARSVGWHARLSVDSRKGYDFKQPVNSLKVAWNYSRPITYKAYISGSVAVYLPLKDNTSPDLQLEIYSVYDHSYFWSSNLTVRQIFYGRGGPLSGHDFRRYDWVSRSYNLDRTIHESMLYVRAYSTLSIYSRGRLMIGLKMDNFVRDRHATTEIFMEYSYIIW